jgi:tetratricopeptide (TPR) repeat protein
MPQQRAHAQTAQRIIAILAIAGLLTPVDAHAAAVANQPVITGPDAPAPAEGKEPATADPLTRVSPVLRLALESEFLTDIERARLRVRHGLATEADIQLPALRAKLALQRGCWDDDALIGARAAAADPLDRAEAAINRGEIDDALAILTGGFGAPGTDSSLRALRLLSEAREMLGLNELAVKSAMQCLRELSAAKPRTAMGIVEAARAGAVILRRGQRAGDDQADAVQNDLNTLMTLLAEARRLDPLSWEARVVEATLLVDRGNFEQAAAALQEAAALNPNASAMSFLGGQIAVMSFDTAGVERFARALDAMAVMPGETVEAKDGQEPHEARMGRSVFATVLRVRIALRVDDIARARELIDRALGTLPRSRWLLHVAIATRAVEYDMPGTQRELDALDTLNARQTSPTGTAPGGDAALAALSADGYFNAGRALADARQYETAAALLREASKRSPGWSEPWSEAGLLAMQSGRDDDALEALNRAQDLDPFNLRVANSLKLMREITKYTRVSSARFEVRAKPGLDLMLAKEMLGALERSADAVTGDGPGGLRHTPAQKTLIDLMPTHAWFAVRIAGMPRIHTIAASTGPVIAMEAPRDGAGHTGAYDWDRVLRHEYTHTVGLSRTGNRIPHWFTEAQAVYLELAPRDYPTVQLLARVVDSDDLFDFSEINIAFTRPKRPTDRQQAYAQGHWMIEHMIGAFGTEAPIKLMDLYAKGVREEEAFQSVLGISRTEFMSRFKVWASEQLVAWGMRTQADLPSLQSLLDAERERLATEQNIKPEDLEGFEPTIAMTDAWLEKHPAHPDVLELAVSLRMNATDGRATPELRPLLERYAKARPVDPMPRRQLATLALASANPSTAAEHLEYLDAREEKSSIYAAELAKIYLSAADLERATKKAERATQMAPYSPAMRELAATVALRNRDLTTARRHLEFLQALEPAVEQHAKRLEALRRLESAPPPKQ